jgi:hypothetical protein
LDVYKREEAQQYKPAIYKRIHEFCEKYKLLIKYVKNKELELIKETSLKRY